jgi:hypothetical protein
VPPAPIIGINDVELIDCAKVLVGIACVATKGPTTKMDVVFELVALFESDAVIT